MTLDALQLTRYQTCRRRWLIERQWKVLKWHPKSLFDSTLRAAVFQLSSGVELQQVLTEARSRYLAAAANPGLDLPPGSDPYQIASDYCAMLATVLTALSRLTLLTLRKLPPVELHQNSSWLPLSFADESGTLHRWLTVDAWDADTQARSVHSWLTVGDMAVCDAPMTLHVIEIGQLRNSRRHSAWARAYRNPAYLPSGPKGQLRFQRPDGKGGWASLRGDKWESVWLADLPQYNVEAWVTLMEQDGVISKLIHHSAISPLSEESRRLVLRQILAEAGEMNRLQSAGTDWAEVPMARGACDGWRPCPWQQGCYSSDPIAAVAESGLYSIRAAAPSGRSEIHPAVASV